MLQLAATAAVSQVVLTQGIAATRSRGSQTYQSRPSEPLFSAIYFHVSYVPRRRARYEHSQPVCETTNTISASSDSAYPN